VNCLFRAAGEFQVCTQVWQVERCNELCICGSFDRTPPCFSPRYYPRNKIVRSKVFKMTVLSKGIRWENAASQRNSFSSTLVVVIGEFADNEFCSRLAGMRTSVYVSLAPIRLLVFSLWLTAGTLWIMRSDSQDNQDGGLGIYWG
jgi:hypothetical protein